MTDIGQDIEQKLASLWLAIGEHTEQSFRKAHAALTAAIVNTDPVMLFEEAALFDSFGYPDKAIPLYEAALFANVPGERRRRAMIQMASSLRNLGHPQKAEEMMRTELGGTPDHLTGAVRGMLALALVDLGREREAAAVALKALSACLPRYNASMARYAQGLVPDASI